MMRNFELDKMVTLREVEAVLRAHVQRKSTNGYHTVDAGDFGTLDVDCDAPSDYEDFAQDVLRELT